MKDLKYWLALARFPKFGPSRFQKIYNYFPSMEEAFKATLSEFQNAGLEEKIAQEFISLKPKIDPDEELKRIKKEKVQVLTIKEESYPRLLKEIYDPPGLLFFKGLLKKQEKSLAVVGTRKATTYGKQVTSEIVKALVQNHLTIVSGLAFGIDTIAHKASLEAQGRTMAILGSGLDRIYPPSNLQLAQEIVDKGGALVSEFPLGTAPLRQNFPWRNRIISGISLGTLVIEAPEKSGALITAYSALEQNREVFAVPGNIYQINSIGSNNLIKRGAKVVTCAQDILETLNIPLATASRAPATITPETEEEKILLKFLAKTPLHLDSLVALSGLDVQNINSTLTIMEIKGWVEDVGGGNYVLTV